MVAAKDLLRHESFDTTLKHYVESNSVELIEHLDAATSKDCPSRTSQQ
ncbi:MAG: hypothetical protein NT137_08505 [Methanomassiliicoccales archaeon]|nr:hypothetical protein [Methanomassiliicoccales archaeon]